MTETPLEAAPAPHFEFIRNGDPTPSLLDWVDGPAIVRKAIGEALNARNIAFLLGAGCSSLQVDGVELGISTMRPLAEEFCTINLLPEGSSGRSADPSASSWLLAAEELAYFGQLGIELAGSEYSRNLECLMEVLYSLRFVLNHSSKPALQARAVMTSSIIAKVHAFLWARCTNGAFARGDTAVSTLYETFYRKLVLRDRSLPRPWIFTTNYDLFNETAMDRLGLPYSNGFSGVVERRFNPSTFRYALAEQLDVSSRKWSAVDGFVYLCKLHGSISWTEDDRGLFPIRELWPTSAPSKVMIFPTPAKQNSSLGSPYADLFREFQSRVVCEQSVLITTGYAFGDEHLNNIIYQALTIPTFRLIIFAGPDTPGEVAKLRALNDPRIWIIGGDGPLTGTRAHYFDTVVEHFLPQRPAERIDEAVRKVLDVMSSPRVEEP
jgi:hypothetical protein